MCVSVCVSWIFWVWETLSWSHIQRKRQIKGKRGRMFFFFFSFCVFGSLCGLMSVSGNHTYQLTNTGRKRNKQQEYSSVNPETKSEKVCKIRTWRGEKKLQGHRGDGFHKCCFFFFILHGIKGHKNTKLTIIPTQMWCCNCKFYRGQDSPQSAKGGGLVNGGRQTAPCWGQRFHTTQHLSVYCCWVLLSDIVFTGYTCQVACG